MFSKEQLAVTKPLVHNRSIQQIIVTPEADPRRKDKFKVINQSLWDEQG